MPTPFAPNILAFKQDVQTIHKPEASFVRIENVAVAAGNSIDVTAEITTALGTAGRNGTAVPVQPSANIDTEGVIVNAPYNATLMFDSVSKEVTKNQGTGNERYAKLTEAGGVFTISFFSRDAAGAEQPDSAPASNYDFEFPYLFQAHNAPAYAGISVTSRNVSQDPDGGGATAAERLTIVTDNVIPDAAGPVNLNGAAWLDWRGFQLSANLAGDAVTIDAAGAITYDSAATGMTISAGEIVTMYYSKP